ncbi:MAG: trimeric intracellular cation channel family protein [Cyclobacteriaceae bacterium]|nr:trimeric intracellular cation channel family protein [Cyclobacteriaceae bacterium HetDA_MAG_MS6]
MEIIALIDVLGTIVFAISGTLTAIDKKMDIFGASVVAFITATGGGTLRDMILGATPPGWVLDPYYLLYVALGVIFSILFKKWILKLKKTLFLFDTIGIAVFTILGVEKALALSLDPMVCVLMGVVSAVFGGVLRDIICNEIPLIFRKEVYALVCAVAGAIYVYGLDDLQIARELKVATIAILTIAARVWIVKYRISLPQIRG